MVKAIEVENLSKHYRLYRKPSDRLKEIIFRRDTAVVKTALQGVSFYVLRGEAFGIVGENGAGKSTLLSIIAGINKPSEGRVSVRGKVASILELGAGFHPELTGLENIYLYAGYYGLSPRDVDRKLDFIKGFSELEDYLDKPVKSYSTGMIMRLAFSTILAIDPDIFIIDEALAVGDLYFQKKVFKKIREFKERGGTILFTSHSTYQISNLCDRALWLKDGRVQAIGNALEVVNEYENYIRQKEGEIVEETPDQNQPSGFSDNHLATIEELSLSSRVLEPGERLEVHITLSSKEKLNVHVGVLFRRNDNEMIALYSTKHEDKLIELRGNKKLVFVFDKFPILYGKYYVEVYLTDENGNVFYDVRSDEIEVKKTSFLDIGVFRIEGKILEK